MAEQVKLYDIVDETAIYDRNHGSLGSYLDAIRRSRRFQIGVGSEKELWRAKTFWSKEPETIAWIDAMKPGEVIFDIGANIGIYTLYAASKCVQVVAVEPVLENYHRLVDNVELNGFQDRVTCIYGALGNVPDGHVFEDITIPDTTIGASGAQVRGAIEGKKRTIPCYEIGYLIYSLGMYPTYIKVDVDGNERDILIEQSIDDVDSILVEVNPEQWPVETAIQEMRDMGFISDPLFNEHRPHSSERRQKEGISAVNMVFKREQEV